MQRPLITEAQVTEALAKGLKKIEVARNAIVTPLASAKALEAGLEIVRVSTNMASEVEASQKTSDATEPVGTSNEADRVVAFGSDHGGFHLKKILKEYAESLGYRTIDLGTDSEEPCDYPDFAYAVAKAVSSGQAWRGVMIDGAGVGSCIVANKVPGVRAVCCHNEFVARNAREHNDTNVLTLGSRVTGTEVCKEILKIWLETWFAGGRHKQRVEKIEQMERRFSAKS